MSLSRAETVASGGDSAGRWPGGDAGLRRLLVLGLGNDILTDDRAGLEVARELREVFRGDPRVVVEETTEMGLALLDLVEGYDDLILVDAVLTGRVAAGALLEFGLSDLDWVPGMAPHGLGVGEVLEAGRALGLRMPGAVRVYAVEAEDPFSLGTVPTSVVAAALPGLRRRVEGAVREWLDLALESGR